MQQALKYNPPKPHYIFETGRAFIQLPIYTKPRMLTFQRLKITAETAMLAKDITHFCKQLLFPDFCQGQCLGIYPGYLSLTQANYMNSQTKYRSLTNLDGYSELLLHRQNNSGPRKLQLTGQLHFQSTGHQPLQPLTFCN